MKPRPRHLILILLIIAAMGGAFYGLTRERATLPESALYGPKPTLVDPPHTLLPTIKVPKAVGWATSEAPTPAAGLVVNAFATGLTHPRWLTVLSNGDVLVAEANSPPRKVSGFESWVMGVLLKRVGAGGSSPNRITLLRDANGDGVAETRSVLLAGLNSPTGMALVGDQLYVANTDSVVRYPFKPGEMRITAKPATMTPMTLSATMLLGMPGLPLDRRRRSLRSISAR